MSYESQSEGRAFLRIVFTTFFIIALMTGLNFLLIFNSLGSNPLLPKRSLSSLATEPEKEKLQTQTPLIEVNCSEPAKKIEISTQATNVRLVFKNCKNVEELINKTNQHQGELFVLKENLWTSDFMFLNAGQNKIYVQLDTKEQLIEINREIINSASLPKAL